VEILSLGPNRDDELPEGDVDTGPEPVEEPAVRENWLAGLVRADALALSGVAILALTVVGLPFLAALDNLFFYAGPFLLTQVAEAWLFVPTLAGAGTATLLGLAALRQTARQELRAWVPALAGATTLVGLLLTAGTVVVWLYAAESELFDEIRRVMFG
jgi:hypothetical protein